jgi:hypothetical protein
VAEEPDRRLPLETLPRVALEHRLLHPVERDLRCFEAFYPYIEPLTYVWYQFRFTMMAKGLIDAAGPDVLRRLWDAFVLSDEQLAGVLGGPASTKSAGAPSKSSPRGTGSCLPPETSGVVSVAPDVAGGVDDQAELSYFLVVGQRVALHRRGEAALAGQAQLIQGHELGRLVDAALEVIGGF